MYIKVFSFYRYLERIWNYNYVKGEEGSGTKRKITPSEDRHIVLSMLSDWEKTPQEVADLFGERRVSARLIRRRIHELTDLKSHWKIKKPFISAKNRRRRVWWCIDRLHYTLDQWKRFLFTDDSEFTLKYNQKIGVLRTSEDANKSLTIMGIWKHDGNIMVWGDFAVHGIGNLYRINGKFELNQSHKIIRNQHIPSAGKRFSIRNLTFQEDNDPKHTKNSTKALYNLLRIPRKDLPANSLDLNPIDNLWQYLNVLCKDRKNNTNKQLFEVLQEAWNRIPKDYLNSFLESMPRRLNVVIKSKIYATEY